MTSLNAALTPAPPSIAADADDATAFRQAAWISIPGAGHCQNCAFCARHDFALAEIPPRQPLHIGADSAYILHVNGHEVMRGPVRGTRKLLFFDTVDIAPFLRAGDNRVEVEAWSPAREDFITASVQPALIAEAPGLFATGRGWMVRKLALLSGGGDIPLFTPQTGFMEVLDLRRCDDGPPWSPAAFVENPLLLNKTLVPRDIPPLSEYAVTPVAPPVAASVANNAVPPLDELSEAIAHEEWTAGGSRFDGALLQPSRNGDAAALLWDFGGEHIGRAAIVVDAPAGTVVDLTYGESRDGANGRLRTLFTNPECHFTDRVILREGRNLIGTRFADRGFRFIQAVFRNFAAPIRILRCEAMAKRYNFRSEAKFCCSDPMLNGIFAQCVETLKACAIDTFVDCPWRERAFWINDLVVESHASLIAFGPHALHRRCLDLAFAQQLPDGQIPGICPMPESRPDLALPAAQLFLPMVVEKYLAYGGGRDCARRHLPQIAANLEFFERQIDGDGVLRPPDGVWNFIDWGFELERISLNGCRTSMLNSLYICALKSTARLATALDAPFPQLAQYPGRIRRTALATARVFRDSASGRLNDCALLEWHRPGVIQSQLAHALWLLAGECSAAQRDTAVAALDDDVLLAPELYLSYFLLEAMGRHGLAIAALDRIRKYWGPIWQSGHPTVFEAAVHQFGTDAFEGLGSLCHGFSAAPVIFFFETILGLRPVDSGGRHFHFDPNLAGLEFACGELPTPCGPIRVEATAKHAEITPPEGITIIRHPRPRS